MRAEQCISKIPNKLVSSHKGTLGNKTRPYWCCNYTSHKRVSCYKL